MGLFSSSLSFDRGRYGSTALVTGASSGIGESFARRLAQEGFSVLVLVARREDRLLALKAELSERYGCEVVPVVLDLSARDAADLLHAELERGGHRIDLVVNNAGFGLLGAFDQLPVERVSSMVDLNCRAVVDIARRFIPPMRERGRGAMIITSSIVGTLPAPWFSVYAATKAFDLYFGEALHGELRGTGVDVVTVLPGLTKTEFHAGLGERDYHSPYRSAEQVVESALGALGRKSIVVDGLFNKFVVHGTRFLPRGVALWLSRAVMRFELMGSAL
ncbi:MAG: SDR family NAD(P)-dependent oxidoreductase [Pseudomonadota bacterium]